MTKEDSRLGLTPILKRLAYSFLCKGLGRHPINHAVYDMVEVSELYPWKPNPEDPDEYGGGVCVSFFRAGRRIRWVEFAIRYGGGGGNEEIFLLKQ